MRPSKSSAELCWAKIDRGEQQAIRTLCIASIRIHTHSGIRIFRGVSILIKQKLPSSRRREEGGKTSRMMIIETANQNYWDFLLIRILHFYSWEKTREIYMGNKNDSDMPKLQWLEDRDLHIKRKQGYSCSSWCDRLLGMQSLPLSLQPYCTKSLPSNHSLDPTTIRVCGRQNTSQVNEITVPPWGSTLSFVYFILWM